MALDVVDTTIAGYATKATYGAAAFAGITGWLSQVDWVSITGLIIAAVTFCTNRHYKRRQDKRDRDRRAEEHAEHEARMKREELESQLRVQLMQHQMSSRTEAEE